MRTCHQSVGRIRARWCSPGREPTGSQLIAGEFGQAGPRQPVAIGRSRRTRERPQSGELRRSHSLHRLRVGYAKERASRRRAQGESAAGSLTASGFEAATTLPSAWGRPRLGKTVPHPFVAEECHRRFRESRGFTCLEPSILVGQGLLPSHGGPGPATVGIEAPIPERDLALGHELRFESGLWPIPSCACRDRR
jgi:hypothetical protein